MTADKTLAMCCCACGCGCSAYAEGPFHLRRSCSCWCHDKTCNCPLHRARREQQTAATGGTR
jgi:hypothetical protein